MMTGHAADGRPSLECGLRIARGMVVHLSTDVASVRPSHRDLQ
jgi:hypothetical protein